jgi:hypothetical protein
MSNYNFRSYTIRNTRERFRENMHEKDRQRIEQLYAEGRRNLEMLKRQSAIQRMYSAEPLVVERKLQQAFARK